MVGKKNRPKSRIACSYKRRSDVDEKSLSAKNAKFIKKVRSARRRLKRAKRFITRVESLLCTAKSNIEPNHDDKKIETASKKVKIGPVKSSNSENTKLTKKSESIKQPKVKNFAQYKNIAIDEKEEHPKFQKFIFPRFKLAWSQIKTLKNEVVKKVLPAPQGAIVPLLDSLKKNEDSSKKKTEDEEADDPELPMTFSKKYQPITIKSVISTRKVPRHLVPKKFQYKGIREFLKENTSFDFEKPSQGTGYIRDGQIKELPDPEVPSEWKAREAQIYTDSDPQSMVPVSFKYKELFPMFTCEWPVVIVDEFLSLYQPKTEDDLGSSENEANEFDEKELAEYL